MNKVSGVLMLLVYIFVATALLASESFGQPYNLQNVLRSSSYFGIIGIGAAVVIITGGIELSIGSVIALAGCALPVMMVQWKWSPAAAMAASLGIALLVGLYDGLLITRLRLPPFIVTLCGLMICRGLARYLTGDQTQGFGSTYDNSVRLLATGKPCSFALLVATAGLVTSLGCAGLWWSRRGTADSVRQRPQWFFGVLIGLALAVSGSSRFWQGWEIHAGERIDLIWDWQLLTWTAQVPEEAIAWPGTLIGWFGWFTIPALVWFTVVAWRGNRSCFWLPAVSQILALILAAPLALYGCGEWLGWEEPWSERWRMLEVFVALGILMGVAGWFLKSGLRAGGDAAQFPAMLTVGSTIMWLVGQTRLMEILVPMPFLIMVGLAIVVAAFLNGTVYGRYLFALGKNEQAARFSGINTERMVMVAYLICGAITGLAAILFTLEVNSVQPSNHGNTYELYAIAAAVLGGCSLKGGEGSIVGVVLGAAVMYLLRNAIFLLGIQDSLEYAIIGLVILAGVITDELVKRLAARRRRATSE